MKLNTAECGASRHHNAAGYDDGERGAGQRIQCRPPGSRDTRSIHRADRRARKCSAGSRRWPDAHKKPGQPCEIEAAKAYHDPLPSTITSNERQPGQRASGDGQAQPRADVICSLASAMAAKAGGHRRARAVGDVDLVDVARLPGSGRSAVSVRPVREGQSCGGQAKAPAHNWRQPSRMPKLQKPAESRLQPGLAAPQNNLL